VSTVERPDAQAPPPAEDVYHRVHADPRYAELRKRHRGFVVPVTAAFLGWYFLFVLMADYAHDFMSTKVWGNINVGLIFGLLQFVSTFAITMWYVRFADRRLDPLADELRAEAERGAS
jgi:uncharacterized membrane protein (DUF485 family)